jgi:DNA-binding beta-propeller fold protein YncE
MHRSSRRNLLKLAAMAPAAAVLAGCTNSDTAPSTGRLLSIWGQHGTSAGRLQKPRAMAIDAEDLLYIVDMTARIQVFTTEGKYVRGWQTPEHEKGRPTGLSVDRRGNVLVADTHYYRLLIYSAQGELLETIGGTQGPGPGEFGLVTDAVDDAAGNLYISEYGEFDRIQCFAPDRKYICEWGGHGREPGQFVRPQNMAFDADGKLWVADACNHRIQVFDTTGNLLTYWGREGTEPGAMYYPYNLALDGRGHVYVCEFGNHRVQKFTLDGRSLGCWGTHGRGPGEMHNPWALVLDSRRQVYVLDTNNHRVQKIAL